MRKKQATGYIIIILLVILIGIVSYGIFGKGDESAIQPNKVVATTTKESSVPIKKDVEVSSTNSLYNGITDKGFITFASIVIDERCPFYQPDGVTYKQCLSDWMDELSKPLLVEQVDEVHAYCETFSKKYAESISFEQSELFTKCSIYKLQP